MIEAKFQNVLEKILRSCCKAGRKKEGVQIVAVTKRVPVELVEEGIRLGLHHLGESRVQEAESKVTLLAENVPPLKWHLIGHLQSNKVNRAVSVFDFIESVDSVKLATLIDERARQISKLQDCLMEVKVSNEPSKTGLNEDEIEKFLEACQSLKHLRVRGILCMAPYSQEKEQCRPYFAKGRKLFEKYLNRFCAEPGLDPILSMGMSNDFEVAIEEGSTEVRIGTALFGP